MSVCRYVCMSVCLQKIHMSKCVGEINCPKHAHAQGTKKKPKKVHLEMRNLKQTELQERKAEEKKRSSETEDHKKQMVTW